MACYFDDHNCSPTNENIRATPQDNYLSLARLLLDTGIAVDMDMDYTSMFGLPKLPGASKEFISSLPQPTAEVDDEEKCTICLEKLINTPGNPQQLPCKHIFHRQCIIPWISRVSNCPLCKADLPTDDSNYEEFKRQKKRKAAREVEIKELHNSMFS